MGNRIFETVLLRKIENFTSTFIEDSSSIFYDIDNKLIHPGEYGKYKENTLKDLLKLLTPHNVSEGFVITSKDKTSTQLDVVLFNKEEAPLLHNNYTNFFSIESTLAIGEVKSKLNKTEFKSALVKLSENKKLQDDRSEKSCYKNKFNLFEHSDIISFLVCSSVSFDPQKVDFDEIYGNIEEKYRHNLILILEKGLFDYNFQFSNLNKNDLSLFKMNKGNLESGFWYEYPRFTFNNNVYKTQNLFHPINENNKFYHIKLFLTHLHHSLSSINLHETNFLFYTDLPISNIFNK